MTKESIKISVIIAVVVGVILQMLGGIIDEMTVFLVSKPIESLIFLGVLILIGLQLRKNA